MKLITYPKRTQLFKQLADTVAQQLRHTLATQSHASLAVPGGTTPAPFFAELRRIELDWARVNITLTDERLVDEQHERSNARLLKTSLLQEHAARANFVPLYTTQGLNTDARLQLGRQSAFAAIRGDLNTDERLQPLKPLSVVVLGMGTDGHIASLFPHAEQLATALDPSNTALTSLIHAPAIPEPRVSLTWSLLSSAQHLHLLITGLDKYTVLQQAISDLTDELSMPVRVLLRHDVTIHYAP